MTLDELKIELAFINSTSAPISLSLYFILENDNGSELKFADIDQIVSNSLLAQFKSYINAKFINNEDLLFGNLTDADDRKNAAYYYDIAEKPGGLECLTTILDNEEQEKFDFGNDDLNSIKAFVILIGNPEHKLSIYKKHYPINYLKRDSILRIFPSDTRFEKVDKNILSINESFEFMQISNNLIVLSTNILEKYFGYESIIRNSASVNLALIEASGLIDDIALLQTLTTELKYAKRIVRIKQTTPVLALSPSIVMSFIQQHPVLKKKIRLNASSTKIALDTKVSQELFLKLLNDDFLKSELTLLLYDSQNKDKLTIETDAG